MLQLKEFYTMYLQYWFFGIYTILTVSTFYFLLKRIILLLLNRCNIQFDDSDISFAVVFLTPAINSVIISYRIWMFIQTFSHDTLSVWSIIFICTAGVWWYNNPLNLNSIIRELSYFSTLAYQMCKLIVSTAFYVWCALVITLFFTYVGYLLGF